MNAAEQSVVQIEYVNGRRTTDVVKMPAGRISEIVGGTGETRVGGASKEWQWFLLDTRDNGFLIVRAEEVNFIRARALEEGEALASWADMQRAFREDALRTSRRTIPSPDDDFVPGDVATDWDRDGGGEGY